MSVRLFHRVLLILVLCGAAAAVTACYKDAGEDIPPTVKLSDLDATLPVVSPTPFVMPSATPGLILSPTTDTLLPSPVPVTPTRMPTITMASPITSMPTVLPATTEAAPTQPVNTPTPTLTVTFILTPDLSDFPAPATSTPTTNPNLLPTPTGVMPVVNPCVHVVQANDTLYSIARENEVELGDLIAANPDLLGGSEYTILQVGWEMRIPGCSDTTPTPTLTPFPGATGAATAVPVDGQQTHVVQAGENLYRISLQYGVTVDAIMQANNLSSDVIYVGQTLIIPPAP